MDAQDWMFRPDVFTQNFSTLVGGRWIHKDDVIPSMFPPEPDVLRFQEQLFISSSGVSV